jgi:predicted cupin superfamily sugar epimerase
MMAHPPKEDIIRKLRLEEHVEGGYFRRTYCHGEPVELAGDVTYQSGSTNGDTKESSGVVDSDSADAADASKSTIDNSKSTTDNSKSTTDVPTTDIDGYSSQNFQCMSSIFYMLTDDSPIGHLHRNSVIQRS